MRSNARQVKLASTSQRMTVGRIGNATVRVKVALPICSGSRSKRVLLHLQKVFNPGYGLAAFDRDGKSRIVLYYPHNPTLSRDLKWVHHRLPFHCHGQHYRAILWNWRLRLQQHPSETDVLAYGVQFGHRFTGVKLDTHRTVQVIAAVFSLYREGRSIVGKGHIRCWFQSQRCCHALRRSIQTRKDMAPQESGLSA